MLSTHCFAHLVVLSFEICFWLEIITNKTTESNWRLSCKKGVCGILGRFLFFAGSSWFLADWLVLTWGASLRNCFCWFALHFREITYAKKLSFPSGIFWSKSFKGVLWRSANLTVTFSSFHSTIFFKLTFWFLKELEK